MVNLMHLFSLSFHNTCLHYQIELDAELGEEGSPDDTSSASASSDAVLSQFRESEEQLEKEQVCRCDAVQEDASV